MRGEMSGNTAKAVSPTSPRVTLLTASELTGNLRYGATRCHQCESKRLHSSSRLTVYQHAIGKRVHRPHVGSPVSMAKATREREQPAKHLLNLSVVGERSECESRSSHDADAELDAVVQLDVEDRPGTEAIHPQ